MTRASLLLLLSALLGGLLVGPAEAAASSQSADRYAATAHQATNEQRTDNGLTVLEKSRCLQRLALKQAKRMAASGTLSHQDLGPVLARCGLRSAGENVAYGYRTGRAVVTKGWMPSAGHRANILGAGFRLEGIGAVRTAGGRWWVAQVFGSRA